MPRPTIVLVVIFV